MNKDDLTRLEALAGVKSAPQQREGLLRDLRALIAFTGRLPVPEAGATTDADVRAEVPEPGRRRAVVHAAAILAAGFPARDGDFLSIPAPARPRQDDA